MNFEKGIENIHIKYTPHMTAESPGENKHPPLHNTPTHVHVGNEMSTDIIDVATSHIYICCPLFMWCMHSDVFCVAYIVIKQLLSKMCV